MYLPDKKAISNIVTTLGVQQTFKIIRRQAVSPTSFTEYINAGATRVKTDGHFPLSIDTTME